MLAALMFGHEQIKKLCAFQEEIVAACGKEKREIELYAVDLEKQSIAKFAQTLKHQFVQLFQLKKNWNVMEKLMI